MMNRRIVLLTGSELRHEFFRKFIASHEDINVLASYCETTKGNLINVVENDLEPKELRTLHLTTREIVEKDFFEVFCTNIEDNSNPILINKGEINNDEYVSKIIELNPDIIISYGCSIIRSKLLNVFKGKFVNIHLGLSPYYRGSGTNFWPFVNNELHFIGTTFMHIDEGVDTGEIIHQIRAIISFNDNIHQIGNRLIRDSSIECIKLIRAFNKLKPMPKIKINASEEKYFKKKDFTEESLSKAYENISNNMIVKYLENKDYYENKYPIIKNPSI